MSQYVIAKIPNGRFIEILSRLNCSESRRIVGTIKQASDATTIAINKFG